MKKLLLILSIAFVSIASANAQCTPDPQYTTPGIYTDSATGFAAGCQDVYYEQLITNVVPVDTTVELIPGFPTTLAFDSIVITNFTGLPASLTYACNTTLGGCSFAGGTTGCAIISGTPTVGDVGTHNLVITVDVYVGGLGTPSSTQDIDWYFIEILDAASCNIGLSENDLTATKLYPNPTENVLTLEGMAANTESITITNLNGQVMNVFNNVNATSMDINVEHLESGIYFVRIDDTEVIRFVKK